MLSRWFTRAGQAFCLLCSATTTLHCARAEPPAVSGVSMITLSILTTNDVHGRIQQLPLFGGYVRNVRAARQKDGGAVLLLDAGDIFQGTVESNSTEGASMIRAFHALQYTASTIGNHEFDFGPVGPHMVPLDPEDDPRGALKARVAQANFPFLNANLTGPDGKLLAVPGLLEQIIVKPRGVPVGIVGGVTADLLRSTHAGNTKGITVQPLADNIAQHARALRDQGARVVIALVHAGGECMETRNPDDLSSCDQQSEVFRLARALPAGSVDVIVAGHTHAGIAQRVNGIAIIESFSNGRAFGRVDINVAIAVAKGSKPPHTDPRKVPLAIKIYPPERLCTEELTQPSCAIGVSYEGLPVMRDSKVVSAIQDDLGRAQAAREKPTGIEILVPVTRESRTESPLNNLVADLMLQSWPGADAAFSNAGGVRIPLPAGPLRYGTVFEMFPFDNAFATLRIPARQLASILAHNLQSSTGILSLSGLRAAASCIRGQLVVQLFDEHGLPVPPERMLTVVTSDFLAASGDDAMKGQTLGPEALTITRDRLMRDALLDRLMAYPGGKIDGSDKRLFDPMRPRLRYPGVRPVLCSAP